MNNLIRIIALSSLCAAMLIAGACGNKITTPNTSFDFSSLEEAEEWVEEHIWVIGALVSETQDKSSMLINPNIVCFQDGVVSYDDDYQLWINDLEIPLEVYGSSSRPQLQVNWDLIHGDLTIPHSNTIHYDFHVNGIEELNGIVLIPSTPIFEAFDFENVDFSSPVVASWDMSNDADSQVIGCNTSYHVPPNSSLGNSVQYFIEAYRRNCTIDIDCILNNYASGWEVVNPTTDNLTIDGLWIQVENYEEQGFNAVYAGKITEIGYIESPWKYDNLEPISIGFL